MTYFCYLYEKVFDMAFLLNEIGDTKKGQKKMGQVVARSLNAKHNKDNGATAWKQYKQAEKSRTAAADGDKDKKYELNKSFKKGFNKQADKEKKADPNYKHGRFSMLSENTIRKIVEQSLRNILGENFTDEYRTKGSLNKKTLEKNAGKTPEEIIADREAKKAEEQEYNPDWDDYSMDNIKGLYGDEEPEFDDTKAGGEYQIDHANPTFYDKNGKEQDADAIGDFHNDFAIVKKDGKVNYINSEGTIISDQWFDACNDFEGGFGLVSMATKRNFVDGQGQLLLSDWVDRAGDFIGDTAPVIINGQRLTVDKQGNIN